MNLTAYQDDKKVTLNFTTHDLDEMQSYFKVAEIFNYTPSEKNAILGCGIRSSYYMSVKNGTESCYRRFDVVKFLKQGNDRTFSFEFGFSVYTFRRIYLLPLQACREKKT